VKRFQPCADCDYPVESSLAYCPNCGLYTSVEQNLFDRLMGRRTEPRRHPESMRVLEASLQAEIDRLESNQAQLLRTRGPLAERVSKARAAGRDPGALLQAAQSIDEALSEAEMLLERHRALLEGIELERQQNALRVDVAELEERTELPPLEAEPRPLASQELDRGAEVSHLAFAPDGTIWALRGRLLLRWGPGRDKLDPLPIPAGAGLSLALDGRGRVLVGGEGGVHLLDPEQGWLPSCLASRNKGWGSRPRLHQISVSPEDSWALAGAEDGGLYRFRLPVLDGEGPVEIERRSEAHPFGCTGVLVTAESKAVSAGTGRLVSWWVAGRAMTKFSDTQVKQVGALLGLDGQVALLAGDTVGLWDESVSACQGELALTGVRGLATAPDGVRLLSWDREGLRLASPATRNSEVLLRPSGRLACAAVQGGHVVVAVDNPVLGGARLVVYDLEQCGLVGWTLAALARLRRNLELAKARLPADPMRRAAFDSTLLGSLRGLVREAGTFALYAITRRAELVEQAAGQDPIPPQAVQHLEALFRELEDLARAFESAAVFAPGLGPGVKRLHRLPTAVLLGQVDKLLDRVEEIFRGVDGADEDALEVAIGRLEGLESYLVQLERLGNGLKGPFWGTPDRPRLVASLESLKEEFPGFIDALHARIAAAALGRMDGLGDAVQLDILRDQKRRIARIGGAGAHVGDAEAVLRDLVEGGPEGQEARGEQREQRMEQLGEARRELGARTEAWLETQKL
jgi:hypothetical protein